MTQTPECHQNVMQLCRVKFDTQQAGDGEEIPLVKAAKTIFDTSDPSFWSLCALVSPLPLLPAIRLLAHMFPGKHMQTSQKAFETLYDASNALIEVRQLAYRACVAVPQCCNPSTLRSTTSCVMFPTTYPVIRVIRA